MDSLLKTHQRFVKDFIAFSKLDSNTYTIFPTLVFLVSSFAVLYYEFHQYNSQFVRWGARLYKDVVFHWAYFYLSRIWFVWIKFARYANSAMDDYIQVTSPKDEISINQMITHSCVFLVVLSTSTVPLMLTTIYQIYRRQLPNFLVWTEVDPWVRSEIGPSGHYLERPVLPISAGPGNTKDCAYRSKRSTSAETKIGVEKQSLVFRPCKSMTTVNVVKSAELLE